MSILIIAITVVLMLCCIPGLKRLWEQWSSSRLTRQNGVEMTAEVIGNAADEFTRRRSQASGHYQGGPLVRYTVAGRSYETMLSDEIGIIREPGTYVTIVVDPDHPYEAVYKGGGGQPIIVDVGGNSGCFFVILTVFLIIEVAAVLAR